MSCSIQEIEAKIVENDTIKEEQIKNQKKNRKQKVSKAIKRNKLPLKGVRIKKKFKK